MIRSIMRKQTNQSICVLVSRQTGLQFMENEYSLLFASDHSFFQLNGSFCTISTLQSSLLHAVRGRTVELTYEQNNRNRQQEIIKHAENTYQ